MSKSLDIKLYYDFICPWCYIAVVRLQRLGESLHERLNVQFKYIPYLLYPHIGPEGIEKSAFKKHKKPGLGNSLRQEASTEGINLNGHLIKLVPSSRDAHRLVQMIGDHTKKQRLIRQIFFDYFEQGQDISDRSYLSNLASQYDIDESQWQQFLDPDPSAMDVDFIMAKAKSDHIRSVPTLEFENQLKIHGLQTLDVYKNYLIRANRMLS